MDKKIALNPNVIQKFKWGGTTSEWEEEAEKLSNQLETIEYINSVNTNSEDNSIYSKK